ncbi:hypothetical protein WMY93_030282 [Mugilogobius chulae]|uniref:Uncharacterized protein n=1 Tax=Mugilogobius chulae TaxID=88201 RepID=A0AAW0MU21_9GOBI
MDFDETAQDNTKAVLEVRGPVFPCPFPPEKNSVLVTDIDVQFLFLDHNRVQPHWHMIRKHLSTQDYTIEELKVWHAVQGVRLAYEDVGYSFHLSLDPDKPGLSMSHPLDMNRMSHIMAKAFESVITDFERRLTNLGVADLSRPTVQKNNLTDLNKMAVYQVDQRWLLALLDTAIATTTVSLKGLRFMVTLVRLGQKDLLLVSVTSLFDSLDNVVALSVHVACTIQSEDKDVDLMWARRMINDLCGRSGFVFTNLPDVPGGYNIEGILNFVQLYCDASHRHQSPYYKHLVSGILATSGVLHKNTIKAMETRAKRYIAHFRDLGNKGAAVLTARVDGAEDNRAFRKELVLTLCRGLERVMTQRTNSAGYDPCWTAF